MGPKEQNQHFTELRQKVSIYIQKLVLLKCLSSLDGKHNRFVAKKRKNATKHLPMTEGQIPHSTMLQVAIEIRIQLPQELP